MTKIQYSEKNKQEAENLELRSEQLRDILGQVPRWIIRFGTILILIVLLVLFFGSALLKFPDVINASVKLTTETPPAELVANISARIKKFYIADKEQVKKDQVLLVFESAARYDDINKLSELLERQLTPDSITELSFPEYLTLGTLQSAYASLQKSIKEYIDFEKLDYYQRKITSVNAELKKYSRYLNRLEDKEAIQKKEYELVIKQFKRDSALHIDEVISSSQYEKSESQKLSKLSEWKNTQTELASSQIEVSNLQQEILELELKYEENKQLLEQQVRESVDKLKGEIAQWEQEYIIRSPFDGQVSLTRVWSENQYIEKGEIVLTVLPSEQGELIGKAMLSAKGVGKVKEGYKVVIRFDNYPYLEFGTVTGTITSISLVPIDDLYAAEFRLDSGRLITNYNMNLSFQQNMPGIAEIITEQRSLLVRILDPFRSAILRQKLLNR